MAISISGSTPITLMSGAVSTVQGSVPVNGFRVHNVDMTNSVYYRIDGIDPVIGGDGALYIAPNSSRWVTNLPDNTAPEIRVISSGIGVKIIVEAALSF